MAEDKRRVAIVGCGVSGLASIKACLQEGLLPRCFEMDSDIGGIWYAPDTPKAGGGPQMYDSLITNTSKAMTCFSDFPCPASYPPFFPHTLFQEYLQSYAQHFGLKQYVSFNTKVINVCKADDYDVTGRWVVTWQQLDSGEETREVYEGVILCQGFFSVPWSPHIPGLKERFQGRVSHVSSFKNPVPYKGRTVMVVGSQASAGDVACDVASVAKQVYLSVHSGAYVISRVHNGRLPLDFLLNRTLMNNLPAWVLSKVLKSRASKYLDPVTSGLKPKPSTPDSQVNVMINDALPIKILTGQVKVVSQVDQVTETGDLHLEDNKVLQQVDDVIFATGYRHHFNVIDPNILTSDTKTGKLELYKMAFPQSLRHDTMVLVGCQRAVGAIPPINELQARLVARVLAGRHTLPERAIRQKDIDRMNQQQLNDFGCYRYQFPSLDISDDIATELGVKPSWWRLLLKGDVKMALAVTCGPSYPFHYRLTGPGAWVGARDATLRAYHETVFASQHRLVEDRAGTGSRQTLWLVLLMSLVVAFVGYVGFRGQ